MIIFQTASGGGDLPYEGTDVLSSAPWKIHSTVFRNDDYIHRLNRTLQFECRIIAAYQGLLGSQDDEEAEQALTDHRSAGRELSRLVVRNQGIPADAPTVSTILANAALNLIRRTPGARAQRMGWTVLLRLETALTKKYRGLLRLAPPGDQQPLTQLLLTTNRHVAVCRDRISE